MSFVRYNESLYRTGFRPYGQTNPRAAAKLDGMSGPIDHGWGSFGPWLLHGPVFTARGGESLSGLGADAGVPTGSLVTYKGTWTSVFNTGAGYHQAGDPQSIVNGVVAALAADGQLNVVQAPNNLSSGFWGIVGGAIGQQKPFPLTLVLQVTGPGFANVNDIISIIRHYVYTVSSLFPQSDVISSVQIPTDPNAPSGINYQAAGLLNPGGFQLPGGGAAASPPATPSDWGAWLQDNFGLIAGLAVGLVVVPPLIKKIF